MTAAFGTSRSTHCPDSVRYGRALNDTGPPKTTRCLTSEHIVAEPR